MFSIWGLGFGVVALVEIKKYGLLFKVLGYRVWKCAFVNGNLKTELNHSRFGICSLLRRIRRTPCPWSSEGSRNYGFRIRNWAFWS
jgi:hypothetical protein